MNPPDEIYDPTLPPAFKTINTILQVVNATINLTQRYWSKPQLSNAQGFFFVFVLRFIHENCIKYDNLANQGIK